MGITDTIIDGCKGYVVLTALVALGAIFESGYIKEGVIAITVVVFIRWLKRG